MAFRTKLDFSSNRQVKQHEKTITALSGGTSFGLPYSAMTSGPDLSTSAVTQTIVSITGYTSTFSGNNTTTQYNWFDTRMSLGESTLSAITSTTSAATQVVSGVYTANTNTTIDGNLVNLTYTGVSYNVNPLTVIDLGGGNYTGTVRTYQLDILSASTLDYTGRTIWNDVSGITRTDRLIISNNPQVGYVWTCLDSEGMGEWSFNASGATIWTAGTGISSAVLGGSNGIASGDTSVSEGTETIAGGTASHAEGYYTQANGNYSHAEGYNTTASGSSSHAEGNTTIATGDYGSHAEGMGSIASGITSHAEGNSTLASGGNSHSQGVGTIASGNNSHAEGVDTTASGNNSHAEGWLAKASGATSHAQGYSSIASGDYSHAQGYQTIASGITSHAEGVNTIAGGQDSHAEGTGTQALGYSAHAEGASTIASGQTAHAEGGFSNAGGDYSHAEGFTTTASGPQSHSEGNETLASGSASHAEGTSTSATTTSSHAEGSYTLASGSSSHAEGNSTVASGPQSHAEGTNTIASGNNSHAQGNVTIASGYYSHAGGYKSTADGEAAFVHSYSSSTLNSNQSAILGGKNAYILDSDYSGILSGLWNQIGLTEAGFNSSAYSAVVLGGNNNTIYEATISSSILGGQYNNIHKYSNYSSLVGGQYNEITGSSINSGIFVGTGNTITNTSKNAAIIAGMNNTISGHSNSVIVGGNSNFIDFCLNNYGTSANETIIGGAGNEMYTADNSFIAGGLYNLIDGRTAGIGSDGSFVIGSFMSSAFTSNYSGILGGWKNAILSSNCSFITNTLILGGSENTYNPDGGTGNGSGSNNIILGGANNILSGSHIFKSAIIGGDSNGILANIDNSVVIGGDSITATTSNTVYVPNMIINTGGTGSMLGINTPTPEYVIDANGNNARLVLADTYTGSDAPFKSFVFSANSTNVPQIVASTSNYTGGLGLALAMGVVGNNSISTASSELVGLSGDTYINSTQQTNNLNIINRSGGSGTNHIRMYAGVNSVSAASVPDFQIQGTGTTRGYIGIKTNNPEYLLDIIGSTTSRAFYDPTSANGSFSVSATTGLPRFGVSTNSGVVNQNGGISMGMRGWDDPTYDTYGKPGDSHLYSSKQANGLVIISSDGTGTEDYIECWVGGDTTSGELAIHMHGTGSTKGFVGIGTNNPAAKLDVDGSVIISGSTNVTGNGRFQTIGSSASSGALHYTSDGTLTTNTSDERLKTNITTLTGALDKVNQLRGVSYNWVENPTGDTRIGFIAQEVNSVVPELAFTNPNSPENYMGVHYDNVTALLVEAVKELSSGVTTSNNTHLETQTILAEDNNIELNYSGTPETAIGGGIRILHALGTDNAAELITDIDGNFVTNNDLKPQALTIPLYTPTSSNDTTGSEGNITRDDNYMYVKTSTGWKRTNLESF